MNSALGNAVGGCLEDAEAAAGVRAIVLTGAGRAFCAGAVLKEIAVGRLSRAMTQAQAGKGLKTASGQETGYVKVVKASKGRYGASHAATETGEMACGTKPRKDAPITDVSVELKETTVARAAPNSAWTTATNPTSGSKRSSSFRSPSAFAPESCASSHGIT